jgi:hypothetical protein
MMITNACVPEKTVLDREGLWILLLGRSDDPLDHHYEKHFPFVPSADPAYPPAIDAVAQSCGPAQTNKAGLDLQFLQWARRCRRGWFGRYGHGFAGYVEGISLRADMNRDSGMPPGLRPGDSDFSRGEWNDLFSHVMTHYLGLDLPGGGRVVAVAEPLAHPVGASGSCMPVESRQQWKWPLIFMKQAPLIVPVDLAGNGPQASLVEALDRRQNEDLFLNVWR